MTGSPSGVRCATTETLWPASTVAVALASGSALAPEPAGRMASAYSPAGSDSGPPMVRGWKSSMMTSPLA